MRSPTQILRFTFKTLAQKSMTFEYGFNRNKDDIGFTSIFDIDVNEKQHRLFAYAVNSYCKWAINRVKYYIKNIRSNWLYVPGAELGKKTSSTSSTTIGDLINQSEKGGLDLLDYIQKYGASVLPYAFGDRSAESWMFYENRCPGSTQIDISRNPFNSDNVKRFKLKPCKKISKKVNTKIRKYTETKWTSGSGLEDNKINFKKAIAFMDPAEGMCDLRFAVGPENFPDLPSKEHKNSFWVQLVTFDLHMYIDVTFAKLKSELFE